MRYALAGILLTALSAMSAAGTPCEGVNRALTSTRRRLLAPVVARQLGVPSVVVLESMVMRKWSVIWVSTPVSGSPFLFYAGEPEHTRFVALWDAPARTAPSPAIKDWALAHAPGIPPALAQCFAWHVAAP